MINIESANNMKGWKRKKIGEVCNLYQGLGINVKTKHYLVKKSNLPLLRIKDLKNNTVEQYIDPNNYPQSCLVNEKDLIYTRTGQIGLVFMGRFGILHNNSFRIVPDESLLREYLFLFLQSDRFKEKIVKLSSRAAQPDITHKLFKEQMIFVPPLSEQKRIVSIVDEAFEAIDIAIDNTKQNLTNARELFDSYLNAIFTQKNDGWEEKKLEDICREITVGHVGSMASKYKESGIPFLRSQNILPFKVKLDNVVFIDDVFHPALKKSQLRPGDLAIVRTGYPGTAAVIPKELEMVNCSDLVIVKPDDNINPHYLCLFFNSVFGKSLVGSRLVGAAQKHFNITTAKKVLIPFPCLIEQDELVAKMNEVAIETQKPNALKLSTAKNSPPSTNSNNPSCTKHLQANSPPIKQI